MLAEVDYSLSACLYFE